MPNGVELWKSLIVGQKFEIFAQDFHLIGIVQKLHTHGAFGECLQFVEIKEIKDPKYWLLDREGAKQEAEEEEWLVVPDHIRSLRRIKE